MPTKTTDDGREYEIDGKRFIWHPLDDNDEPGNLPDIVIPLRMKLGVIRELAHEDQDNVDTMLKMLERIIPGQAEKLDEMDLVLDFVPMFTTWQHEYNQLIGSSLGE